MTLQHKDVQSFKIMKDAGVAHTLLDVREEFERTRANIVGSLHIPLGNLIHEHEGLDLEWTIVVFCHHGIRSVSACVLLTQLGAKNVFNLSGGIDAWARQVDPTVATY